MVHKSRETYKGHRIAVILIAAIFISSLSVLFLVEAATPEGPSITYINNTSKTVTPATLRAGDQKGTITTLNLNAQQQNDHWKAYIGNVTGKLVLQDAQGYNIYDWTLNTNFSGNIYTTRVNNVVWSNVACANTSTIAGEETFLNETSGAADTIANTFNSTGEAAFLAAGVSLSGCQYTATYINSTSQTQNATAKFQEMLLQDNTTLIYTTRIENNQMGYNPNSTFDFQMLVADSASPGITLPYYFYIEIQ